MTHTPGEIAAGRMAHSIQNWPDWYSWEELDDESRARWIKFGMAAVNAYRDAETCRWRKIGDFSWMSDCDNEMIAPGAIPVPTRITYCPCCGRKVKDVTP